LEYDEAYTVKVGQDAKDKDGNNLPEEFLLTFSTVGEEKLSKKAPKIVSVEPKDGASLEPIGTKISITFDRAMNKKSVERAFKLSSSTNPSIPCSSSWIGRTTVIFTPLSSLEYDTTYKITINTNAQDKDGNNLPSAREWSFKTEGMPKSKEIIIEEKDEETDKYSMKTTLQIGIIIVIIILIAFLLRKKKII
ncbi:MAG: Ig-like domain-containing protein, partial [Candidatus Thermoplasmatota archaeon]